MYFESRFYNSSSPLILLLHPFPCVSTTVRNLVPSTVRRPQPCADFGTSHPLYRAQKGAKGRCTQQLKVKAQSAGARPTLNQPKRVQRTPPKETREFRGRTHRSIGPARDGLGPRGNMTHEERMNQRTKTSVSVWRSANFKRPGVVDDVSASLRFLLLWQLKRPLLLLLWR